MLRCAALRAQAITDVPTADRGCERLQKRISIEFHFDYSYAALHIR